MTVLTVLLALGAARAETADEVVAKAREANQVESSIQTVKMTIVSKTGSERVRDLELRSRRDGETVSSYIELTSPTDVAGTKMLMIDHPDQTDEQLMYLPAYKRVNRISGAQRKGSFVGSDFTYEDMEIRQAAEGKHTLVEENADVWVIETIPTDSPQYSKIRSHISKSDHLARKVEFFDDKGEAVKVLDVGKTAQEGTVTIPLESTMTNVQKGTKTVLAITAHKLNVSAEELPAETFTPAFLER